MNAFSYKTPPVQTDVHPLIQKRWSPRAFADRPISDEQMEELFEAASWAASAFNEQPWRYVYARRGTEGFDQLVSALSPGNQQWAARAAVILVNLYQESYTHNGKTNHWAVHDTGMANAQLLLQAAHRDIYGHLMAGFDASRIVDLLELETGVAPLVMGVLGYLGDFNDLPEALQKREKAPRQRQKVGSFVEKW